MQRSLLIPALLLATGCDDWSAVERASIPRLVVEPPTAPVVGGIDVTTTLSLAIYNNGPVDAGSPSKTRCCSTRPATSSRSISVVPNSAIPVISAGASLSLSFDVTPDQTVDSGVLQLTVATTHRILRSAHRRGARLDRDGADHPVAAKTAMIKTRHWP